MKYSIVCICIVISTCSADYYGPYPPPFYKGIYKGPYYKGIYKSPYYKGIYKAPFYKSFYKGPIYKEPIFDYPDDDEYPYFGYAEPWPIEKDGDSLIDYWNTFKEIFLQSYEDLKKPYVVEKPVPVPVPVDRVRTIVKKYPVFIKQNNNPGLVVIRRYKHH